MRVTWDDHKRQLNLRNHKLAFEEHEEFQWEDALILPGKPGKRGEPRFRAVGVWRTGLVTIVFSPLGSEAISLISMRPSSRSERRHYARR
jgi:uncharacterized DUF497 family protein